MPSVDFSQYSLITNVLTGSGSSQGFPAFVAGQQAAYKQLCTMWFCADIRAEYPNLNFDVDAHANDLNPQSYPGDGFGFKQADWTGMCQKISLEVGAVGNVRALYQNFTDFNTAVFVEEGDTLTSIKDGLNFADSATTSLWPGALVEGVFYAIFSTMGPMGACIANVVAAAWNTAQAAGSWDPSKQLQVEYDDILNTLLQSWTSVTNAAGDQETEILQDWGMTQAVSTLCGNQLATTSAQLQQAQTLGESQFAAGVLQLMMPGACVISGSLFNTGNPPQPTTNSWVLTLTNGTWCEFQLMMQINNYGDPVPSDLLDYIWAAKTPRSAVFLSQNGWQIPYDNFTINGWAHGIASDNDSALLVFFLNATGDSLYVNASNPIGSDETTFLPSSSGLPPNGFAMFAAGYKDGPSLDFQIFSNTVNQGSVASCTVSETVGPLQGGTVSISNANWVDGFSLTSFTANGNWGGGENGTPGVAVINVNYTPQ
ncbi:MAG: hypothetical protein H7255_04045 [Ramlibacter sp.]|nr:hypothetical protein [Ramlibacter sp.]